MDDYTIDKLIDDISDSSITSESNNSSDEYLPVTEDDSEDEFTPSPKRRKLCKRLFETGDPDIHEAENENLEVENGTPLPEPVLMTDSENGNIINNTPIANADSSKELNSSLVPYSDTESEEVTPMKERKKQRKWQRNPKKWKKNIRKENRQQGKSYTSTSGKNIPDKKLKHSDCRCKFNCCDQISKDDRESIMLSYYKISQNEKKHFILKNTECKMSIRTKDKNNPQKKNAFSYFFHLDNKKVRVCKQFFLQTILVSQKTIYNVHNNKDKQTEVPKSDDRGKKTKDRIPKTDKDFVRKHIESFAKVESHYCRAKTSKEYLSPDLNISRMYDLYLEHCKEAKAKPLSISMYRTIFNSEYNLDFLLPKSDRCDLCEEYSMSKKENRLSEELITKYEYHLLKKTFMRNERKKDCESNEVVVCFDLQNVIALPRANVSCFFYKRKLNVYNLTAHCSEDKKGYCAIWHEGLCGRSGNDIASAVIKLLTKISSSFPDVKKYILWSDSCVPQNRNSLISYAIASFLDKNKHVDQITMKYSTPGHSCIQEVDNIHSNIEKSLKLSEVWSPVSLLRVILASNKKAPYSVVQMSSTDFFDYKTESKNYAYNGCPYTKISQLQFLRSDLLRVKFKTSHDPYEPWNSTHLLSNGKKSTRGTKTASPLPAIRWGARNVKEKTPLPTKKVKDIKSMLKWMPAVDVEYLNSILL